MEYKQYPRALRFFLKAVFVLVFVWGLYGIVYLLFDRLTKVNPSIGAAIVAGMLALFGVLFTQRQTKVREIAETHREHKAEIYDSLFDIIELMAATKDQADYREQHFAEKVAAPARKFTRGLIEWGSPDMIAEWRRYRMEQKAIELSGGATEDKLKDIFLSMDRLLQAVRRDLGNSNFGLENGDLVSLFFSDPEEINEYRGSRSKEPKN